MIRMRRNGARVGLVMLVIVTGWLGSGCARKATEPPPAAPAPAPTPPAPKAPETPAPEPQEPALRSSDFQPAFFDFDSAVLRDDARSALDQNARLLRENSDARVTIEGHCDERGTVEYNQALGERRAQAAMEYLQAAGIPAARMNMVSYGKDRPFDPGHDERAWAQNRRAHFVTR